MLTYSSAPCFYNYKQSASCLLEQLERRRSNFCWFSSRKIQQSIKDVVTTKVIEPSNELNSVIGGNISYCCCIPYAFGVVEFVALQVLSTFLPSFIAGHFATLIALQLVSLLIPFYLWCPHSCSFHFWWLHNTSKKLFLELLKKKKILFGTTKLKLEKLGTNSTFLVVYCLCWPCGA